MEKNNNNIAFILTYQCFIYEWKTRYDDNNIFIHMEWHFNFVYANIHYSHQIAPHNVCLQLRKTILIALEKPLFISTIYNR